jgi:hypothetical protein
MGTGTDVVANPGLLVKDPAPAGIGLAITGRRCHSETPRESCAGTLRTDPPQPVFQTP